MTDETNQRNCNTCTCACHEFEENHDPDDCYCMRAPSREAIYEAEKNFELEAQEQHWGNYGYD